MYYCPGEQNGSVDAMSRQEWSDQQDENNLCLGKGLSLAGEMQSQAPYEKTWTLLE